MSYYGPHGAFAVVHHVLRRSARTPLASQIVLQQALVIGYELPHDTLTPVHHVLRGSVWRPCAAFRQKPSVEERSSLLSMVFAVKGQACRSLPLCLRPPCGSWRRSSSRLQWLRLGKRVCVVAVV